MSNEELVGKIKAGNTELLHDLWDNIEKFIKYKADRFMLHSIRPDYSLFEDMVNESYFAMIEAVNSYDADKGVKFITYLDFFLHKSFDTVCYGGRTKRNMNDPLNNYMPIDAPVSNEYDNLTIADMLIDENSTAEFESYENIEFWWSVNNFLQKHIERITDTIGREILLYMLETGCTFTGAYTKLYPEETRSYIQYHYDKGTRILRKMLRKSESRIEAGKIGLQYEDYHTGLNAFRNHGNTSATELAAISNVMKEQTNRKIAELLRYSTYIQQVEN